MSEKEEPTNPHNLGWYYRNVTRYLTSNRRSNITVDVIYFERQGDRDLPSAFFTSQMPTMIRAKPGQSWGLNPSLPYGEPSPTTSQSEN